MTTKTYKTPTIREVASLLRSLKPQIRDDYRAYDDSEDDIPSMLVTVGADDQGNWGFQTGDTSFTGGAYGFPHWGQAVLCRNSNCHELALSIVDEIADSLTMEEES